jgi:hypothetical protein
MLNEKVGDLSDRWRELGQLYLEYAGGLNSVFFDLHTVIGLCFGGEPTAAGKIANTIQEQARMHRVCSEGRKEGERIRGTGKNICILLSRKILHRATTTGAPMSAVFL